MITLCILQEKAVLYMSYVCTCVMCINLRQTIATSKCLRLGPSSPKWSISSLGIDGDTPVPPTLAHNSLHITTLFGS